ncbi:MAG: segregation/condensation protein A [Spirochaetales bacterium]|uniref:segregation and condensation protein A n=1 Tax=Bullifex sp. TaxID=2815808 RepID=UPI002A57ACFC|nr:segregation/condensation protein A [Bullifex sp.]MDD7272126.1 segregation/condensation protein A [Spirochaetales bacterium]MDY4066430.1 segregation/condensation protein A [Bullifex sp.]
MITESQENFGEVKQVFKTEEFEGPLDLLLYQIQKAEINIYNIPICEITEQFIEYINTHKTTLRNLADFYKMAADLLYIKSRMLLPVEVEFDEEYEDPRRELVDRLLDYQKFKKYTDLLMGVTTSDSFYIPRRENLFALPFEDKDLFKDVTLQTLLETYSKLVKQIAPNKLFNVYEEVTVKEKIALMGELLEKSNEIKLSDLIKDFTNPLHIICSFMAILESCKFSMILIRQDEEFGEIYITKRPLDFDERDADDVDRSYDEIVEHDLADADDFSVITKDAKAIIEAEEIQYETNKEEEDLEYIGDEENLLDEED